MRIDKLEIALRPRPAPQALDLGFALLHAHAGAVYKTWLVLWLAASALGLALILLLPEYGWLGLMLAWWLRPLLERGPLYVLSRQVFGEAVTWRQALRAWPGQLGGGTVRLLTWWRFVMPGRGLYQPIWQLERARGKEAAERRGAIGRNGTAGAAYRFGLACAHFEAILQFGVVALIGLFLSNGPTANPLAYLAEARGEQWQALNLVFFGAYAAGAAVMGPVYTACCFTLYLNRRATLEAWDIELTLRQIEAPAARRQAQAGRASPLLLAAAAALAALAFSLGGALAQPAAAQECKPPKELLQERVRQTAPRDARQAALRREVAQLYASEDLRGYKCELAWRLKDARPAQREQPQPLPDLAWLALTVKILLIAGALGLLAWLLYRYRARFAWLLAEREPAGATEIAGLDIRAESLPDDVAAAVRSLWQQGERRAALALLYRATLSRLVAQDGLHLASGATEGDCLRAAQRAALPPRRLDVAGAATALWLGAAYGARWPGDAALHAACDAWRAEFDAAPAAHAVPVQGAPS